MPMIVALLALLAQDALDQVKTEMAKNEAVLVDVREQKEWDEGHIEGALLLPLSWLRDASKESVAEKLPAKKILYVHCRSGARARTAAGMLKKQGYDARPLKSGFEELVQAGFTRAK
jgi:rhodanese-related sulfurtransferase